MATVTVELPESVASELADDADDRTRQVRLALAVDGYVLGRLSQGRAAEIAGLGRPDFLAALAERHIDALQITADELADEVEHDLRSRRERLASDLSDASRTP